LSALDGENRLRAVLDEGRRIGGLPEDADSAMLRRMVDFCERGMVAYKSYVPQPIEVPVLLFRAEDQRHYRELSVDPRRGLPIDMGWGPYATRGVSIHAAPGEHMSMIFGANAISLGARLEACLRGLLS
jgi:hypothetical protein